jgi:hypothetical protein
VELRVPTEAIYGFEHQARSKADEDKRATALARLQEHIGTMVIFATDRDCQFTTPKIAVVEDGEHERAPGPRQGGQAKKSGEHSERFLALLFESCARTRATLIFVSHDRSLMPLFDRSLALTGINKAPGPGTL